MDRKAKILIIEDEEAIRKGLEDVFVFHGYQVSSEVDGKRGLDRAAVEDHDLVILDVMLPSLDGFSICSELKAKKPEQLVIMLTAKTGEEDIINGLRLGADDYVGKPFSITELVLRVEAVLRRVRSSGKLPPELVIGETLKIDTRNLLGVSFERNGNKREIVFTRRELDILYYLKMNNTGPVSRETLLEEVWGYKRAAQIETRTVDIHIAKLRRKIEVDPKSPTLLVTVRGEGYRLLF